MPSFQIIPLSEADLPAILAVYRQCEDFLALGPLATASEEMVRADMGLSRSQGGHFCGISLADGTLAGVLDYIPAGWEGDPDCAFLELLMIGAPYRAHGLGADVFAWLLAQLRAAGTRRLAAGVQVNNPKAVRFWQRMGLRIVSEPELLLDGTTCVQLAMNL
jgi:GNAT superfamily N-acetyltransferase